MLKILIIEDDPLCLANLEINLKSLDIKYRLATAENKVQAYRELDKNPDLAFIDIDIHGEVLGFELTSYAKNKGIYSVILTSHDDEDFIEKGIEASKADDYLVKPASRKVLENVFNDFRRLNQSQKIKSIIGEMFITKDEDTIESIELIKDVYNSSCPINLIGPSGVGKGLLASIIHNLKFGSDSNFYQLNCASLSANLIESELFGHEKGSFTGADDQKLGLFELADKGTLFLDELGTMPMKMQEKILKAVDEKQFFRVGGNSPIKSDFRLISATSSDLHEMVQNGTFKLDLFFRINQIHIKLKPLSERKCDILPAINHFFLRFNEGRRIVLRKEAKNLLVNYSWPGNNREIKNFVEECVTLGHKVITKEIALAHINKYKNLNKARSTSYLSEEILEEIHREGFESFSETLKEQATWETYIQTGKRVRETMRRLRIGRKFIEKVRSKYEECDHIQA